MKGETANGSMGGICGGALKGWRSCCSLSVNIRWLALILGIF